MGQTCRKRAKPAGEGGEEGCKSFIVSLISTKLNRKINHDEWNLIEMKSF